MPPHALSRREHVGAQNATKNSYIKVYTARLVSVLPNLALSSRVHSLLTQIVIDKVIAMSSPEYDSSELQPVRQSKRTTDDKRGVSASSNKSHKHREYKTYNYDPLPRSRGTIRILELFSSEKTDAGVLCALITPEENERAQYPYEALSWCWGAAAKTDYIRIQRNRKTYNKYVSANLVAAMKALRYPDRSRYLWIDMVRGAHYEVVGNKH